MSIQSMVLPIADSFASTTATLFSILQAATHSPHPVHFCRSMTIPHFMASRSLFRDLFHAHTDRSPGTSPAQRIHAEIEERDRVRPGPPSIAPQLRMALSCGNRQDLGGHRRDDP